MPRLFSCGLYLFSNLFVVLPAGAKEPPEVPTAHDPRLVVELFAAAPDIVHPIGADFDSKGRLLVIESHTHFPPKDYQGPKFDRIRMLEDANGSGKANRITTFYEGTKHTMDIAVHPDGSVYLATRNEVLRLRDTKGTGKADERQRLVFLDTKGDYPHNGLSGLCFDSRGNLYFGMGENLGAPYKLIGSDGTTIAGGGEGGHVFWCTADGKKLRDVATGFWNPFGIGRDIYGRLFAVDNDPDAMPPCRMVHVVEGGDYGFQFRYGRAGRHLFQAWNGELPGTLPMMTGVGEAPCKIVSYQSDGLPTSYLNKLLVTSWADHRVESYATKEKGSSFVAEREPFIQGGPHFHPVGLALAPDGSLFVTDWVLKDYELHGRGAVWHVRAKDALKPNRPKEPEQALFSLHRPLRDEASRKLARNEVGQAFLRHQLSDKHARVRAASLEALIDSGAGQLDLLALAAKDPEIGIRAMAVRALTASGGDARRFLENGQPPEVKRAAIPSLVKATDIPRLLELLVDPDPFIRHAATWQLGYHIDLLTAIDARGQSDPRVRQALVLAERASGRITPFVKMGGFLEDPDEDVRFLAVKWIADEKLQECRPLIAVALKDPKLNVRMYGAYSTALARLDGQPVDEKKLAEFYFTRLTDSRSPPALRVLALQLVPAKDPRLTLEFLGKLLSESDPELRLEAVRALAEHPNPKRVAMLLGVVRDVKQSVAVRAQAIVGLADHAQEHVAELLSLASKEPALRDEALRALIGTQLQPQERSALGDLARSPDSKRDLIDRVLGKPFFRDRPPAKDLDVWLKLVEGPADAGTGRRIFAHPKLAGCFRCHRVEGRGNEVGPDLSVIGRVERRALLESILQPSNNVAPHYQVWMIETADGKVRNGMLTGTYLDDYTYLDEKGATFKVNTRDIVSSRPVPTSIMPDGLVDFLTDQEFRDLLAYLSARK
jgi:putative membrane-bound dehydrogenase-like protein